MKFNNKSMVLLTLAATTLASCSSMKTTKDNRDPFENYNRKMYAFNDSAYETLTPLAQGYDNVVPDSVQSGIFNIMNNLREPGRIINDMFQGEWGYAGDDSVRFLTNTTVGLLGYYDPADSMLGKEMRYHQSFAVTLHKWGAYDDNEASPYVVWPLAGPGTLEDVSMGVDAMFNPLTYVFFFAPVGAVVSWGVSVGITGTYYVNQGVAYLPAYNNLNEVSIDPYVAMRNAYLQNYDYGMAKVLKQELAQDDDAIETDKAVLGVLGLDDADAENQVASNRKVKASEPPVMLKTKLATINKASQVDESFDADYSNDSDAIDLSNLDEKADQATISESKDINVQIENAVADLPGDADNAPEAVKTLEEQN